MATRRGRIVLIGMAVLVIASLWRAMSVEYEKRRLTVAYEEARRLLTELEVEIDDELKGGRRTSAARASELSELRDELQDARDELAETIVALTGLQHERDELQERHAALEVQLTVLRREKQQLEAKFSSIKELRLAIRELRRQVWRDRWQAFHQSFEARAEAVRKADQEQLVAGNRGYVVQEGASTLGADQRLHVHVLELESTR